MPVLNWIGKDKIVNHDKDLPFRVLKPSRELSEGASDNLVIRGDNLEGLKALLPFYAGKVKCIYIDPPYNTGNQTWKYNDRVDAPQIREWPHKTVGPEGQDLCRHDKWLCMMYPRLKILHELLDDDGVIFISIDDNEYHNLRLVCNEIFSPQNFVASLVWEKKKKGSHLDSDITNVKEYVVAYRKSAKFKGLVGQIVSDLETYPCINPGNGYSTRIIPKGTPSNYAKKDVELSAGHIISSGNMKLTLKDDLSIKNGILQSPVSIEAEWRYQQSSLDQFAAKGTLYFTRDLYLRNKVTDIRSKRLKDLLPRVSSSELANAYDDLYEATSADEIDEQKVKEINSRIGELEAGVSHFNVDDLMADGWGSNEDADNEQRAIFGEKLFDYPKPVKLIKKLIASTRFKEGYILDSFAGSGTTGQAVLELNKADGGDRKFILIELEEEIAEKITSERIRRVIKGYKGAAYEEGTGGSFSYLHLNGELFNKDGFINKSAAYEDVASYVYYSETNQYLVLDKISEPLLGKRNGTSYYLLFKDINKNTLDDKAFKSIKDEPGIKVVYADKCLIDQDICDKHDVVFKQIPYELRSF